MAAYAPDLELEQRVELLETIDVEARLHLALSWARETLAELELKDRIRTEVTDGIDAQQREMLLRRQMDAIRKELGESDDDAAAEYRARADALELPDAVRTAVDKELDKFERMGAQNPEQAWVRNWLDAVLDLPWGTYVTEDADLGAARAVLDADHDGLDDVKERILEFLAVRVLRRERGLGTAASGRGSGAILGLVGPPGVGKTSLGESVARASGPAVRAHRRGRCARRGRDPWAPSYLRRCARRVASSARLTEAKAMNPVVLIDEVDKLQAGGWSGDPSSALLEVLDPAQNHTFRDHYLELDLDLSDVLFLTTANVLDTIPGPLLDRMELVQLDGYTEDEKVAIAKHHLFPRQREKAGLREDELEVTDEALHALVEGWTREAGVRNLERQLGKVVRKAARKVAAGETATVVVDTDTLNDYVGPAALPRGGRDPCTGARSGDRARGDGCRRRRADDRGHGDGRRARSASDRTAGRRDVGVGADRVVVRAGQRRGARRARRARSIIGASTCTFRRVRCRRTVRRPASR